MGVDTTEGDDGYDKYCKAVDRMMDAKLQMDIAQAELDAAETEYHEACRAVDKLDAASK